MLKFMAALVIFSALSTHAFLSPFFVNQHHISFPARIGKVCGLKEDMEALRLEKQENDYLSIGLSAGLIDEKTVQRERAYAAKKEQKKEVTESKFGEWMGGLMVGTPFSPEKETNPEEEGILEKLVRRVEERRIELGLNEEKIDETAINKPATLIEGVSEEDSPVLRRRRRKVDPSS